MYHKYFKELISLINPKNNKLTIKDINEQIYYTYMFTCLLIEEHKNTNVDEICNINNMNYELLNKKIRQIFNINLDVKFIRYYNMIIKLLIKNVKYINHDNILSTIYNDFVTDLSTNRFHYVPIYYLPPSKNILTIINSIINDSPQNEIEYLNYSCGISLIESYILTHTNKTYDFDLYENDNNFLDISNLNLKYNSKNNKCSYVLHKTFNFSYINNKYDIIIYNAMNRLDSSILIKFVQLLNKNGILIIMLMTNDLTNSIFDIFQYDVYNLGPNEFKKYVEKYISIVVIKNDIDSNNINDNDNDINI